VVSCENIVTIPVSALGRSLGFFFPSQEAALSAAIRAAFDLELPAARAGHGHTGKTRSQQVVW
jgi:hypothetical protein